MTLEEKKENLSYIVEHMLFASSVTAFGKLFTETGKNLGRRITKGELKNYDAVYEDFYSVMGLTQDDLVDLVWADRTATFMYAVYKKQMVSIPEAERLAYRSQLLVTLVEEDFRHLPEDYIAFGDELREMSYDNWFNYLHCIALFYLKCGEYVIYHKNFHRDYDHICADLLALFEMGLPHRLDLVRVVSTYKENPIYMSQIPQSIWGVVQLLEVFLSFASHPGQIENYMSLMELMDWEDETYWVVPEQLVKEDTSEVWWMSSLPSEQVGHGYYFLSRLQAKDSPERYDLTDLFTLTFFSGDAPHRVQLAHPNCPGSVVFGMAEWDEEKRKLRFHMDGACPVPEELFLLDKTQATGKQTHIWKSVLNRLENEEYDALFKALHERNLNQKLLDDDYKVVDVIVSRRWLELVVCDVREKEKILEHKDELEHEDDLEKTYQHRYRIDLAHYEFLRHVTPGDEVELSRHNSDGQLYANWFGLDFTIPLSEFDLLC